MFKKYYKQIDETKEDSYCSFKKNEKKKDLVLLAKYLTLPKIKNTMNYFYKTKPTLQHNKNPNNGDMKSVLKSKIQSNIITQELETVEKPYIFDFQLS